MLAKEVGDTLATAYPGFLWLIEIPDHNVVIRLANANQIGWSMFLNRKDLPVGSPEKLKKLIIRFGGEMLERLNIQRRAMEEGQHFGVLEGTEHKALLAASAYSHNDTSKIILPDSYTK